MRPTSEPAWFDSLPQVDRDLADEELFDGPARADTKTNQLCRRVEEALRCALLCAEHSLLRDLLITGVEPLRGASLMRVLVETPDPTHEPKTLEIALEKACGYLRAEVARSIHRKRVPGLRFEVVPGGGPGATEESSDE